MVSCGFNGGLRAGKGRKLVASGKRRMTSPPADLQLQYWFSVLVADKGKKAISRDALEPLDEPHISTKRRPRLIAVGDSLLQGTDAPVC